MRKITGTILLILLANVSFSASKQKLIAPYDMNRYDAVITKLYKTVPDSHSQVYEKRIAADSRFFLGQAYILGALGEGPSGRFDQRPLYRTDGFDCVTLISTVIALANSENLAEFQKLLPKIRYKYGQIDFATRNHFMSVDWNKNNSYQGLVQDITYQIHDRHGKPIAAIANTIINKPTWFKQMSSHRISLLKPLSDSSLKQRTDALHTVSESQEQAKAVMLYLPLTKLFNKQGKANPYLFNQIPTGSVIEIVRPNWNLKKRIGTNMHVSHLGLAIRTKQGLMYREASLIKHKVVDIPLSEYLKNYLKSPTIKGINVQKITPLKA